MIYCIYYIHKYSKVFSTTLSYIKTAKETSEPCWDPAEKPVKYDQKLRKINLHEIKTKNAPKKADLALI